MATRNLIVGLMMERRVIVGGVCLAMIAAGIALQAAQKESAAKLIEQLTSPDPKLQIAAAERLGNLRPVEPGVVDALLKAVDDKNSDVGCLATAALGEIGKMAKSSIPKLIEIAKSETQPPIRRTHALMALGRIGEEPDKVVPVIVAALKSQDGTVLWGAMFGSVGFKAHSKEFVTPLVEIVRRRVTTQQDAEFAGLACEGLAQFAFDQASAPAMPALIDELLTDIDAYRKRQEASRGKPRDSATDWRHYKAGKVAGALGRIQELAKDKNPQVIPVLASRWANAAERLWINPPPRMTKAIG